LKTEIPPKRRFFGRIRPPECTSREVENNAIFVTRTNRASRKS
jgi:hypothetical protein